MAASEVATLCGTIISTASKIQELGNNWYKASKSWNDFPRQVECLRRKNDFWQAEFANFGMSSDKAMNDTLREATLLLEAQEAKLLKRLEAEEATLLKRPVKGTNIANCFPGCWTKLSMTIFPAQVGHDIETVISAFDNIQKLLTNEEEAAGALEKRELRRTFSLPFSKDDRYVPLEVSESAIRSALEDVNPGCPRVVLLHGAAGKGKSTLARAVALHYKEVADRTAVFDNVVYLECGPQPDISNMQFKLLQLLGSGAAAPQEQARQLDSDSDLTIVQRLKGLLRDRKLLVILDDVWEGGFLQIMVDLCGRRVKCLVTSQLGHLCRDLNCSPIEIRIEDVQPEVAKNILASHVRLPHHQIPRHLEKIADRMIRETEGNPLALASIAAGIDHTRCDELDAWEAASNNLFEMLHSESPAFIQSKVYPRSFWSSMKLSIESLEKEAQNLLILAHMCNGLSLPEEVIELLYGSTKGQWGSGSFARLRKELESRELIKITLISENPPKQRSWSIHSLQKQFLQEDSTMNTAKETILTSLKGLFCIQTKSRVQPKVGRGLSVEEVEIMSTLVGLYLNDKQLSLRAVSKMARDISSPTFSNLRRSAIEPITRLLGFPLSDRWTEKLRTSAKQVFMMYIYNGKLDDEGISDLLGSQLSTLAMITTIRDIATLEEMTLLDEKSYSFMKVLINLLQGEDNRTIEDNETNATIQMAAGGALVSLCQNKVRSIYILTKFPSVLEVVVKLLLTDSHDRRVRSLASLILAHLTVKTSLKIIIQYPGALTCLVKSLREIANPSLQSCAAFVLLNLAYGDDDRKLKIINSIGAVEELVKSLSKDENPSLQKHAAMALANLACGDAETQLKIINSIGALEELVKSLSKDNNPELQQQAAMALANLAGGDGGGRLKVVNSIGTLEELVKSLSKDDNPSLQVLAARALANLAGGDGDIELKIINSVGAIEKLVKSLSKDNNPGLQEQAAWALANLTGGDVENKLQVINSIGALEELVNSLTKDDNHGLQEQAARGLANLAGGDGQSKLKIINFIGALEKLVKSLSNDDNPGLQKQAARALANLTHGDGKVRLKTINFIGALEELVKSLSKDDNPGLQEHVARALANLTCGDDKITVKLMNSTRVVEELVKSLSKDGNPGLQKRAACALANLVDGDGERKLQVINSVGALEELVKSLSKDDNPDLQGQAARVLAILSYGDCEMKLKVINSMGIMGELVASLSKDKNPGLQKHAACNLANLASGDGESKVKIINSCGALEELVESLSKEDNPSLQKEATRALVNLGIGDGERKSKT